jgi:hypothetical protein
MTSDLCVFESNMKLPVIAVTVILRHNSLSPGATAQQ